ncbi:hypothetical protein [Tenacibaculum maritimum]|uniref:hypothetical protein n=1 Tax=Tenacibaculum maritimum TaxID=107401 RepID=UPI003875E97E
MIKRIKLEELPDVLTDDVVKILAYMSNEIPPSKEWKEISGNLNDEDFWRIVDKKSEIQMREHQQWLDSLSEEEKKEEKRKGKKAQNDPDGFYGNMENPEYP